MSLLPGFELQAAGSVHTTMYADAFLFSARNRTPTGAEQHPTVEGVCRLTLPPPAPPILRHPIRPYLPPVDKKDQSIRSTRSLKSIASTPSGIGRSPRRCDGSGRAWRCAPLLIHPRVVESLSFLRRLEDLAQQEGKRSHQKTSKNGVQFYSSSETISSCHQATPCCVFSDLALRSYSVDDVDILVCARASS